MWARTSRFAQCCQGGCQGAEAKTFGYRWRIRGWCAAAAVAHARGRPVLKPTWASEDGRCSSEVHRFSRPPVAHLPLPSADTSERMALFSR